MNSVLAWSDKPPEREGAKNIVYDLAFSPDGLRLVAAAGKRVLVYEAESGGLLHSLKGHKAAVHCVAYSADGKLFASGGADKQVIVWTPAGEGVLKYTHAESVQALAYNPVTHALLSASACDFGLWSADARSVPKHGLPARPLCASWSSDGQHLALGLLSGQVSVRDRLRPDVEKAALRLGGPAWCLQWNPSRDEAADSLAVGCWDGSLSVHELRLEGGGGAELLPLGRERQLGFDPCCVSFLANGEYLLVGGSGRGAWLHSKEGKPLAQVASAAGWVWACRPRPGASSVAVGCHDGTVAMHALQLPPVFAMHGCRFAYRASLGEVVVEAAEGAGQAERVRIRARGTVSAIAVHAGRLALQLPDRVALYELDSPDDPHDLAYRPCERLPCGSEEGGLLLGGAHVLHWAGKRLSARDRAGALCAEWSLDANIRCARVCGGAVGCEGVLLGLSSGAVCRVHLHSPFPATLATFAGPVVCADLCPARRRLLAVEEGGRLSVVELASGKAEEVAADGVVAACFNALLEDMLAFSGNGRLSVRTGSFPLHSQLLSGSVVAFRGLTAYCVQDVGLRAVEIPQVAHLQQYAEAALFGKAAEAACLGVPPADWAELGGAALRGLDLAVARQAFCVTRELPLLDLVERLGAARKGPPAEEPALLQAEALAFQGRFGEAARLMARAGRPERAVRLWSELCRWDEAKALARTAGPAAGAELARRQAEWAERTNDWRAAAESYLGAGQPLAAVRLLCAHEGAGKQLRALAASLPGSAAEELALIGDYLKGAGDREAAKEAYAKRGDAPALLALAVEGEAWEEALALAEGQPQLAAAVHLPHAQWLGSRDRWAEAHQAYKRAGRADKAASLLSALSHDAALQGRYADAAHHLHLLATQALGAAAQDGAAASRARDGKARRGDGGSGSEGGAAALESALESYWAMRTTSEAYSAYALVHAYWAQPFTTEAADTIFHCCRFLLAATGRVCPPFLSRGLVLSSLAKAARQLGGFKLCRQAHARLAAYRLPEAWREQLELQALCVRAKPCVDSEELLCVCYRCQAASPLLPPSGSAADECAACRHPFVRSALCCEVLPLVRFALPPRMSAQEAERLVAREPPPAAARRAPSASPWAAAGGGSGGADVLTLGGADEEGEGEGGEDDGGFVQSLLHFEAGQPFVPPEVDEAMLLACRPEQVFVQRVAGEGVPLPWAWYKNVVPEIAISQCGACNRFFHAEEWEAAVLAQAQCPFCRAPQTAE